MYRREFLKYAGTTLGVAAACGRFASAAEKKQRAWKIAIGLNGFESSAAKYQKEFPLDEVLSFAQKEGFDGVELNSELAGGRRLSPGGGKGSRGGREKGL